MSDDRTTGLFVFLVVFWILVIMGSMLFSIPLSKSDPTSVKDTGINALVKIMAFQYTDQIPVLLTIFLDATLIFSIWVMIITIRG